MMSRRLTFLAPLALALLLFASVGARPFAQAVVSGGQTIVVLASTVAPYVVGDIFYANSTTTIAAVAAVATGNVLLSGGVGTLPAWGKVGLTTHVTGCLPVANGGTNCPSAGTATASTGLVLDANLAVNTLRATTNRTLGGTGVPGAATVLTERTYTVTGIADATPTAVLTITVPNAAHVAQAEVCVTGILGAGGAIGAGEASASNCYAITLVRTAGVNAVATASAAFGSSASAVAGADTVTTTAAVSAVSGAVGASNTFTVTVTITKSGGASASHSALVYARLLNGNATGITLS
jgi:hypothetical protein